MHISEFLYLQTCLKELTIFLKCGENFEKLLQPIRFLKILLFNRYHILGTVPNTFCSNPSHFVPLDLGVLLIDNPNEKCRFSTE